MEEVSPCAIINIIAPVKLHGVWIRQAITTSPIWLTEE